MTTEKQTPHDHVRSLDGGRFQEWSLADFAGQCRMQAREQLDPEFTQFMAELARRLEVIAAAPEPHMRGLTEQQQQAQAALDKVMKCRFNNFDAGAVIHWAERGLYGVKADPEPQSHPRGGSRALDDLLYHLEPFLAAAAVVIERPDQYQPVVARIGGIGNARDLRVEDFKRLVSAHAALASAPEVSE